MTTITLTHVIRSTAAYRHVRRHHNAVKQCRAVHAVAMPGLRLQEFAAVVTVCGGETRVEDLSGYGAYNCRPETDPAKVSCKKCRKRMGV